MPAANMNASTNTIVECPSEKKNPTLNGRLPSDISLRVVLSIAEMWSASKAVVMRRDQREQQEEADRVQADHDRRHQRDGPPLASVERDPAPAPPGHAAPAC